MSDTVETCIPQEHIESLLYFASRAPQHGCFVEIGVYKGGSAYALSQFERELYLFDTFCGMPEAGELDTGNPVGKFADTSLEEVQRLIPTATCVAGVFPQSLRELEAGFMRLPPVAFVHADADNYAVTKAIIEEMPRRMVRGGFILFDDFDVPDCQGATQAVKESGLRYTVISDSGKALMIV